MTRSMFLDCRSEVLRILPIAIDQQPKNTNAPIRYNSRIFNPTKQYPIVSSSGQGLISYGTRFRSTNLIHKIYQNDFARIIKLPLANDVPSRPRVRSPVYWLPASQMSHE
ncbi:hypothetical protein YC2023_024540 [Brassica napus]